MVEVPTDPPILEKTHTGLGDHKGDGEYWIDPVKSGNPLKVYCDMTTDGGDLWKIRSDFIKRGSSLAIPINVNCCYVIAEDHFSEKVAKSDSKRARFVPSAKR